MVKFMLFNFLEVFMRVIHRISESASKEKELMELLDAHGVPYDADYILF